MDSVVKNPAVEGEPEKGLVEAYRLFKVLNIDSDMV
jgi:hypothetical protein